MNRIDLLFSERKKNILSVFFTAGYPEPGSAPGIIRCLADAGADMIEIGIPFSDPVADGYVIQGSSEKALMNGMTIKNLFGQLEGIRKSVSIPLLLMGYLNPILKFGMENFCNKCVETGIDGVIIPDLPPEIYLNQYSGIFKFRGIHNIFLITPTTNEQRIKTIDIIGSGFLYLVSSNSVTGLNGNFTKDQMSYFIRIKEMRLKNPRLIGFGISDRKSFREACRVANGAIIGSAFIKMLASGGERAGNIRKFVDEFKS